MRFWKIALLATFALFFVSVDVSLGDIVHVKADGPQVDTGAWIGTDAWSPNEGEKSGLVTFLTAPIGDEVSITNLTFEITAVWTQSFQWQIEIYDATSGGLDTLLGSKLNPWVDYDASGGQYNATVSFDFSESPISVSSGQEIAFKATVPNSIVDGFPDGGVAFAPVLVAKQIPQQWKYYLTGGALENGVDYEDPQFDMTFEVVPEPAALALLAVGGICSILRRRK